MKTQLTICLLALVVLMACTSDDGSISPTEPEAPLVTLNFSTPPIDLQGIDAQFAANVPYDEFDQTTFDIFLPNSSAPTGLIIFIHGGGFTSGDKAFIYTDNFETEVIELLNNGIA